MFYLGVRGLTEKTIYIKGVWYSRSESPFFYWLNTLTFLIAPLIMLLLVIFRAVKL